MSISCCYGYVKCSSRLTAKVCHYYYRDQRTMAEIGGRLGLSRHKVGLLRGEALANGPVQIEIRTGCERPKLEEQLEQELDLESADVVDVEDDATEDEIEKNAGAAGAEIQREFATGRRRIGIRWGKATYDIVRHFPSMPNTEAAVPRWSIAATFLGGKSSRSRKRAPSAACSSTRS